MPQYASAGRAPLPVHAARPRIARYLAVVSDALGGMIQFFDDADDRDLDEEFPLGDGTADTEGRVMCPYCGEVSDIALDPGSGAAQEYVEDCEVCCQPWLVRVRYGADGAAHVEVEAADSSR